MPDERSETHSLFFGDLAPGATLLGQPIRIDSAGPFCLREIAFTGSGGQEIPSITIKFQDPSGLFVEQDFTAQLAEIPYPGGPGAVSVVTPIVPQLIYPPNATIQVYLTNGNPSATLPNARIILKGATLYPNGSVLTRQAYPKYFRELPYNYVVQITQTQAVTLDNIVNIASDSDFALRAMLITQKSQVATPPAFNSFAGLDFQILLKDQNGKYFNHPFKQSVAPQLQGVFFGTIAGEAAASRPGLFGPEIYLKRNSALYFDLVGPAASLPATYYVHFRGAKIFESSTPC